MDSKGWLADFLQYVEWMEPCRRRLGLLMALHKGARMSICSPKLVEVLQIQAISERILRASEKPLPEEFDEEVEHETEYETEYASDY